MTNYDKFEEFNEVLVEAIAKHMDIYEKIEPYAWHVGRINLRYAIEREMYFNFVFNIEHFYKLYIEKKADQTIKKFKSDILKLMVGQEIVPLKIPETRVDNFLEKKLAMYPGSSKTMLFSIVSLKFLKYAENILTNLHYPFHLLCFDKSHETIRYMEEKNYPYTIFEAYYDASIFDPYLQGLHSSVMLSSLVNVVCNIKPSVIVNFEGCHVSDQLLCEIGNLMSIKTVGIQHGYAPFYPSTFRNMNYSKFLTWGQYFSEGFKPYNTNTELIAVGNHVIGNNFHQNTRVKKIGFFVQVVKYYITLKYFEDFISLILQTADAHTDAAIIVREHPSNPIPQKYIDQLHSRKNIEFMNKQTHTIAEVIEQCDIAVSISSASLVEALEAGVIPIYVNLPKLTMFERLRQKNPFLSMPQTSSEAYQIIKKLIDDDIHFGNVKQSLVSKKEYLFSASGDDAIRNIVRELEC